MKCSEHCPLNQVPTSAVNTVLIPSGIIQHNVLHLVGVNHVDKNPIFHTQSINSSKTEAIYNELCFLHSVLG